MDKGKIAEWFISLVMERAPAATVVGDLLEAGASRGAGWFWSNVMRIWIVTVWRDGRSQPGFVLGMAALGALAHWGVSFVGSLAFLFATEIVRNAFSAPLSIQGMVLLAHLQGLTAFFAGSFYAGQWIARFSLGRDVAVCFAMTIVGQIIFCGLGALFWCFMVFLQGRMPRPAFDWWHPWMVSALAFYLLGAALMRRRRQVAETS